MKVLWFVNIIFPEAERLLGWSEELKSTGGWLVASGEELALEGIDLCVASQSGLVHELKFLKGERTLYAIIPNDNKGLVNSFKVIKESFQPDIIHIHGTESPMGDVWVKEYGSCNVVLSVQGVLSAILKYHHKGLSNWDIFLNLTMHDVLRKTIWGEQKGYVEKSEKERTLIRQLKYVLGRTFFDNAYIVNINPGIRYFHCNESLREEFYSGKWNYDKCEKHTLFLSQGHAPLKGLHFLLLALPLVIKKYPDTKVRIGGVNIIKNKSIGERLRLSGYGKFILGIIKKYGLKERVEFLGPLNATKMKEELIKANVYVCPSTIENSPNSLAEAQILGTPCVGSDAGGIPDFISSREFGLLYRYDDPIMLAHCICESFQASSSYDNTLMRKCAAKRHNRLINCTAMIKIYNQILNGE